MKTTSVTRLKNTLSAQLKEVVAGKTVLITERRKPIALLQPLHCGAAGATLDGLFERGILAPPSKTLDLKAFFKTAPGHCTASLSGAIMDEREGR